MTMRWEDLAFLHWRYPPEIVRPLVPASLELDLFDGSAWIGVVPFRMSHVGPRGLDSLPGVSRFAELNVRTYARTGDRAGVWFFSLDAESRVAVEGARLLFHLPYFHARMSCREQSGAIVYESERRDRRGKQAIFRARYRPSGAIANEQRSALETWLTERYCLFAADPRGRVYMGDVHHRRWPLERGEAEIESSSMIEAAGLPAPQGEPLVHFSRELDVLAWPLSLLG
jgi:uncharacterized protein YqjF (DUF2071 family)